MKIEDILIEQQKIQENQNDSTKGSLTMLDSELSSQSPLQLKFQKFCSLDNLNVINLDKSYNEEEEEFLKYMLNNEEKSEKQQQSNQKNQQSQSVCTNNYLAEKKIKKQAVILQKVQRNTKIAPMKQKLTDQDKKELQEYKYGLNIDIKKLKHIVSHYNSNIAAHNIDAAYTGRLQNKKRTRVQKLERQKLEKNSNIDKIVQENDNNNNNQKINNQTKQQIQQKQEESDKQNNQKKYISQNSACNSDNKQENGEILKKAKQRKSVQFTEHVEIFTVKSYKKYNYNPQQLILENKNNEGEKKCSIF